MNTGHDATILTPAQPTLQQVAELIASVLLKKRQIQLVAQCDGRMIADVSYQESTVNGLPQQRMTLHLSAGTRLVVTSQPTLSDAGQAIQITAHNSERHIIQFLPMKQFLQFDKVWSMVRNG